MVVCSEPNRKPVTEHRKTRPIGIADNYLCGLSRTKQRLSTLHNIYESDFAFVYSTRSAYLRSFLQYTTLGQA